MTDDKPMVFIVDDDARVRESLSNLMTSVGLRVTETRCTKLKCVCKAIDNK